MSDSNTTVSIGGGFFGLLTIAFIILKLTDVISWSWWWVLSPMIFNLAIGLLFLIILLIAVIILALKN